MIIFNNVAIKPFTTVIIYYENTDQIIETLQ